LKVEKGWRISGDIMVKPKLPAPRKHTKLLIVQIVVLLLMTAFAAAMVPLYSLLCHALNISVPRAAVGDVGVAGSGIKPTDRVVEVRFVGEVSKGVPMTFAPMTYSMRVHVGAPVLTAYKAFNTSPVGMDGVAVHMIYGMGGRGEDGDIADYIDLRQCFCFELQHYPAGEEKMLPLNFIITPDLPAGVHTITFAYTLFKALPNDPRVRKKG
jgi:cytochrome c oxidase assembly protein subunit 11